MILNSSQSTDPHQILSHIGIDDIDAPGTGYMAFNLKELAETFLNRLNSRVKIMSLDNLNSLHLHDDRHLRKKAPG